MSEVIRVENLGKCYRVSHQTQLGRYQTLRDTLVEAIKAPIRRFLGSTPSQKSEDFWALKDVSFDVKLGEVVGIIGRNGAGKSTLLKILSRITKPSKGRVELHGRVGSLLEVGTGFHPELTGRENIYLNGSILGMSRKEINTRFDEIVSFSGVEQFLDTPVKRYSSGMYVRLAFSVAAHLNPEILLVDEVLAVGDYSFQQKCIGRMGEISKGGRTVMLISHDLTMLARLCSRIIWIQNGTVFQAGNPTDLINAYYKQNLQQVVDAHQADLRDHPSRSKKMQPILQRVRLKNSFGDYTNTIFIGESLSVVMDLDHLPGVSDTNITIEVCDHAGMPITQASTYIQSQLTLGGYKSVTIQCQFDNIRFLPGTYSLNLAVGNLDDYIDRVNGAVSFTIEPFDLYKTGRLPNRRYGCYASETKWSIMDSEQG